MPAPNDPTGGGEVLSQSEGVAPPATPEPPASSAPEAAVPAPGDAVRLFDFRQPSFLTPADMRRLRLRHEEFIRSLSARLSIYLRLEFGLRLLGLQTVSYRKFVEALPTPTHLTLFKAEPLRGIGIVEVPRVLGLSIIERLLGGTAQASATDHEFSEIETALLDQVVNLVLAEWCALWAGVQPLQPTLLGHEDDGKFLQTAPRDAVMLSLRMEATFCEANGPLQLILPCAMIEPLARKLTPLSEVTPVGPPAPATLPRWNRHFDEVPVPVTAVWNDLELTARQVASLKPGDVLPLDSESAQRVKLRLGDLPKFEGRLGTTNGKWAVAVTGVVKCLPAPA